MSLIVARMACGKPDLPASRESVLRLLWVRYVLPFVRELLLDASHGNGMSMYILGLGLLNDISSNLIALLKVVHLELWRQ